MCSWFLLVVIILWPVFPQLFHASRTVRFRFRGKFEGICGRGDAGGFGNYSCFRQNIYWAISGLFEALVYLLQTISLFYYYPFFISCNKSFSMYIRRKWSTSRLLFHPKTITPSFRSGEGDEETARGTNRAEAKERTALSAQSSPATGARLRPKERPGCRLIRSIDCSSWKFAICNSAHRCFFSERSCDFQFNGFSPLASRNRDIELIVVFVHSSWRYWPILVHCHFLAEFVLLLTVEPLGIGLQVCIEV